MSSPKSTSNHQTACDMTVKNLNYILPGETLPYQLGNKEDYYEKLTERLCAKETARGSNRWLVGCLGFNGPLRQYFSLYRAVSQREGEREEKR